MAESKRDELLARLARRRNLVETDGTFFEKARQESNSDATWNGSFSVGSKQELVYEKAEVQSKSDARCEIGAYTRPCTDAVADRSHRVRLPCGSSSTPRLLVGAHRMREQESLDQSSLPDQVQIGATNDDVKDGAEKTSSFAETKDVSANSSTLPVILGIHSSREHDSLEQSSLPDQVQVEGTDDDDKDCAETLTSIAETKDACGSSSTLPVILGDHSMREDDSLEQSLLLDQVQVEGADSDVNRCAETQISIAETKDAPHTLEIQYAILRVATPCRPGLNSGGSSRCLAAPETDCAPTSRFNSEVATTEAPCSVRNSTVHKTVHAGDSDAEFLDTARLKNCSALSRQHALGSQKGAWSILGILRNAVAAHGIDNSSDDGH